MLCVPWHVDRPGHLSIEEFKFVATPTLSTRHANLEAAKQKVGVFKAKHGDAKWKMQVSNVDRQVNFSNVSSKPISRAYFKLIEIVRTAAISPPTLSLHLCEAPGGFAQAALTEFESLKSANFMSLLTNGMPYFSPQLLHEKRAYRLELDHYCDILHHEVRSQIAKEVSNADLITGDGAIDNDMQPELSESATAMIVACEIETALRAQKKGGSFVVKIFGLTLPITKQMVAILAMAYKSVSILKPHTSRSVNDERYVVCQDFLPEHAPPFKIPTDHAPGLHLEHVASVDDEWMKQIDAISDQMASAQQDAIEKALRSTSTDGMPRNGRGGRRGGRGPPTQRGGRSHPYSDSGKGRGPRTNRTS